MLAYFDLFVGISGDMILGALVDAGLPVKVLEETVAALGLSDAVTITARKVRKGTLTGTKVTIITHDQPDVPHTGAFTQVHSPHLSDHPDPHVHPQDPLPHRHLGDILTLIDGASLPAEVKARAARAFRRLAEAEARVHGTAIEEVHFHEVGALDAIVDIVAAMAGLNALGVTRVAASPVPLTRGYAKSTHGPIPVPAPATTALLTGIPVRGLDLEVETVTPTGAAIITTLAEDFGPVPAMTLRRVGYGAGTLDLPIPNMLRLLLGDPVSQPAAGLDVQTLTVLSTNVDDMPGEWFGPLFDRLLAAGALDVWFTPVQMKKNRPAVTVTVLAEPHVVPELRLILLRETTTLGVREEPVTRWCLPREVRTVQTPWGPVRVKVARLPDGYEKAAPEFEDCRRLAEEHDVPLPQVYLAAMEK